jgi:protein SCO1/2
MFFGYTRCPDICPATLAILNKTYEIIETFNLPPSQVPQVIFISIDSEFDNHTYTRVNNYAKSFNKHFIGLSGSKNHIANLAKSMGVVYQTVGLNDDDVDINYMYDHSSTVFLINPKGQLQAIFTAPHKAENLARDYKTLINKYS